MSRFDLVTPGWGRPELEQETHRVYDVCDGCRRCFNLCPSFNTLLDRIDNYDSDVTKLTNPDFEQVEKECYSCKLCYNHCPYTPPHQYGIDFPHLMTAWKKQRITEQGITWRDRLLVKTDRLGKFGSLTATITNWALRQPWIRSIMESTIGIHRDRHVLPYDKEPFSTWWQGHTASTPQTSPTRKVVLFPSCLVNYQAVDIGKATVQVLESNGIEVVVPKGQQCCGMPSLELGDIETMAQTAHQQWHMFKPYVNEGYDIVIPAPSCSLMFKREYPYITKSPELEHMATRTFDVCEYLMRVKKEGGLSMTFHSNPGRIAYQIPCHLRDQNIGWKSKELMELTGAQVNLIERCSGHDGTWGVKKEFFDLSMTIAKKAVRDIDQAPVDRVASDCPLSALQLDQARTGQSDAVLPTLHPIQIVRDALQRQP
ncbi:MAG: hypothetical protein GKS05_02405 [Nitrospirales bacterium]|nr:hypothetical protein [Nitrospirales bacterium]